MAPMYYRNAQASAVVYDITKAVSRRAGCEGAEVGLPVCRVSEVGGGARSKGELGGSV